MTDNQIITTLTTYSVHVPRYQRQQLKDGLLPHRTETLTLSPSRIKTHHPKCPKLISQVLASQLTHNNPKYQQQKATNLHPDNSGLKMPINIPNTIQAAAQPQSNSNMDLLCGSRNLHNFNQHSHADGVKKALPDDIENISSPDCTELSNADRGKIPYGQQVGEIPTSSTGSVDQQKTILLKISNVSESEQLLVSWKHLRVFFHGAWVYIRIFTCPINYILSTRGTVLAF